MDKAAWVDRAKWADQVKKTVHRLHIHDIVWGDVKADNVLIDNKSGNAIVIDFGGGCILEYIDPVLQETKRDDL
jgi:tRNA A-37 threonylcarbamoyl transferase component Bud32